MMERRNTGGLRLLFAGCPAIALPSLEKIAEGAKAGRWILAGILSNPDKAKGRGVLTGATDVCRRAALLTEEFTALGHSPPAILKYETLKAEARKAVSELNPNLLVSFAYGKIFGPKFLALFPYGGINVHPSLLPKYRGASPIQEAILHLDSETGISIQRLAPEMDTGNILAQEKIPLTGRETTSLLSEIAAIRGAELLFDVLEQFREAVAQNTTEDAEIIKVPAGIPQQGESSYCTVLEKNSGVIDWNRSAPEIDAQIRACNPWPLAQTSHNGQTLNILEAIPYAGGCSPSELSGTAASAGWVLGIDKKSGILVQTGDGLLAVLLLQYQNRKILPWQVFLNGARDFIGSRLGGY